MAEYKSKTEKIVPKLKISHKGLFDFTDLYEEIKRWLMHSGYGDESKNFHEKKYLERIKGDSKQIEIKWIAEKGISDYFKNQIIVTFLVIAMKDAETEWRGKKIKTNYADIEIELSANLITNANGKWDANSFMKRFYERYIVRDRAEDYKIDLYDDTYKLQNLIKAIFELRKL